MKNLILISMLMFLGITVYAVENNDNPPPPPPGSTLYCPNHTPTACSGEYYAPLAIHHSGCRPTQPQCCSDNPGTCGVSVNDNDSLLQPDINDGPAQNPVEIYQANWATNIKFRCGNDTLHQLDLNQSTSVLDYCRTRGGFMRWEIEATSFGSTKALQDPTWEEVDETGPGTGTGTGPDLYNGNQNFANE